MQYVFAALCAALLAVSSHAQEAPPAAAPGGVVAPVAADAAGPVPVPVPSEEAMRYYRSGNVLWIVGILWGLLVPAALLFSGFSAWLRTQAQRIGKYWPVTLGIFWILFNIVVTLVDLPLDYYRGFVRPHAYGLSQQALSKYAQDSLIELALNCVIGALLIWIPYLLLRKSPKHWWVLVSAIAAPFMVLQMLVVPVWIQPLFNKFGPMKDKALEARILGIAERAGIHGGRVYEVEKSVDTNTVNAYVTGFGPTKRIVLWDTLLQKLDEKETLFVMAHEMGHYVLGHVAKSILFGTVLVTFALFVVHLVAGRLIRRFETRFGFNSLADPAALPLILLIVGVLANFIGPVAMLYSRTNEHEADRFALEITRDNHAGASAFVKLQQENLGNPRPDWFVKVWRGSHPALGERIDFCNQYKPWVEGTPGKYEDLFKQDE
jgi:STE24 endopeptidase